MNFTASYVSREDLKSYILKHLKKSTQRKDDFEPYTEPFRPLNDMELQSTYRFDCKDYQSSPIHSYSEILVSYQALPGGFTICNIILDNRLYSGSSHCVKSDRWLPIRGKMIAFRRALESKGVELPTEKYFVSDGLVHKTSQEE